MLGTTRARWLLILAAALAVHAAVIVHRRQSHVGDFDVSRELGRRLLAHEALYADGLHYPYLPAAALAFAPLALLPAWVGFALRYLLALACLALTLRWLHLLARRRHPQLAAHQARVAAVTIVLALPYVVRDLDDSGPHLILLALVVGGLMCGARGRAALAAACIGLATAVKATHGLLIPFFLLTRQTRLAGWTAAATALWMLAPLPLMGPSSWYRHHVEWTQTALASVRLAPRLAVAADSEDRVQNQSLAAVTRRWAQRWVDGDTARALAGLAALTLLVVVARCAAGTRPGDGQWLPSAAAVLIGAALLSPATWVQHLVLVIPALYLIVARRSATTGIPSRGVDCALLTYVVLALVLNRELLGRERYLILLAGGIHTAAMLIILTLVVSPGATRLRAPHVQGDQPVLPSSHTS